MILIAFESNGETSVMHYCAEDQSDAAITAEIARAGFGRPQWRAITPREYAAIRDSRKRPDPPILPADAQRDDVVDLLIAAIERMNERQNKQDERLRLQELKLDATIDETVRTDIEGGAL